jgi:sigma-E factor negative regulatory protein RseC
MIEETGVVIETEGITARVKVQKRGACEGCAATGACETSEEGMEIKALNPVQACAGQTVRISIKPQSYLKGSMMIYGLPMTALIAGAIIGKNIGEKYFIDFDSDMIAAIAGFAMLLITFLFAKNWSRKAETKTEYQPVIEEILDDATPSDP